MSDKILGIIGNLEGKGKGRVTRTFALVFTPNELIVVKIGGTMSLFKKFVVMAISESYGISTISDVYNQLVGKKSDELKDANIQDILDADKLNYAIPYSEIEKVEVKKMGLLSPRGRMIITINTKNKNYWFRITEQQLFNEYVDLTRKALPTKAT